MTLIALLLSLALVQDAIDQARDEAVAAVKRALDPGPELRPTPPFS
jgi:hypothetical protein